jgi:hypothetical protein
VSLKDVPDEVVEIFFLKKCSNIIGHGPHTKGRTHMGRVGKGKET